MNDNKGLVVWMIYDSPTDFPGKFVARKWFASAGGPTPTDEHHVADTLEEVRDKLPPNLFLLSRYEDDEPHIVEVWL